MTLNIASHFKTHALQNPDQLMVQSGDQQLTFEQFWSASQRLATAMKSLGVRTGDRVVIAQPNRVEAIVSQTAVLILGGIAIPIEPATPSDKVQEILTHSRAIGLIANYDIWSEHLAVLRQIRTCLIHIVHEAGEQNLMWESVWRWEDLVMFTDGNIDIEWTQPHDTAVLFFRPNKSGQLTAIPLSHINLHFLATRLTSQVWQLAPGDQLLSSPDSNFQFARLLPLIGAVAGASTTMIEEHSKPADVLALISRQKINFAIFDGPLSRYMLLNMPSEPANFAQLHASFIGSGNFSHQFVTELINRYGVSISIGFAMQDTVPLTFTAVDASLNDLRSYGQPLMGSEIEIRGQNGGRAAPYHGGSIYARGPQLNAEWELMASGSERRTGWIDTGHLGYLNEAGQLFLTHGKPDDAIMDSTPSRAAENMPEFLQPKAWAASVYGR